MRIKLTSTYQDSTRTLKPGEVVDLPDPVAEDMVRQGAAKRIRLVPVIRIDPRRLDARRVA